MSESTYANITWNIGRHTKRNQTSQNTGSDSVKIRCSKAAALCLVLLCVLLLTAVIVLCVHIHTKNKNHTEEKEQLLTKITNLTEERDQLLTKITNLTEETDQLLTKITNLTEEKDQLLTKITNLTEEREQLITKITNLTEEREQLLTKITNLTEERERLLTKITILTEERDQIVKKNTQLKKERDGLLSNGWINYQSSFYFLSSLKKNWIESRRYCTERGADLIIINNKEEQDFVKKISANALVWIGLTDSEVERTWKWVDGSTLTSGSSFWDPREPNGGTGENCALNYSPGWADYPCSDLFQWICEKGSLK
ncbi:CD209 antigen-like protein C [Carassius auratus]|uniref:CD209 antigen-like protein C n=1 Tax=Carassius auratus TaxID=7957 RepID=A0A6P6KVI3_CARAU|nr:CD209 antigen-like protein C [Carassius auratus]